MPSDAETAPGSAGAVQWLRGEPERQLSRPRSGGEAGRLNPRTCKIPQAMLPLPCLDHEYEKFFDNSCLGCLYANAFLKALRVHACTGQTRAGGGLRRISIWAYPDPTENGGGAANGTTEQCDG